MSKFSKYLVYSGYYPKRGMAVLAVAAAAVATLLLFPGPAMGISSNVDPDKSSYLLGEVIQFDGEIGLSDGETKQISSVTLTVNGSQGFTQVLPTAVGTYAYPDNDLSVVVTWSGVAYASGYGSYGYGYTGTGSSAKIEYSISWDPPILLDPPPTYSLAPNTVSAFDIPQATTPSLPAGLPAELPTLSTGFDIPALSAVDPNAPDPLPTLTVLANAIPLKSTPAQGAPSDLTATEEVSDVAFAIPTVTDDLVAGVASAPDSTALVTTSDDILAIARDGNGNVYALVDGGGSNVDKIKKYDSSGAVVSAFGSSGVADVKDGNGTDITVAKGIAAADSKLWVSHNQGALDHNGGGGFDKRWIQQFDISDGSHSTECYLRRGGQETNTIFPITGIGDYIWGFNEDNNDVQRWDMTGSCNDINRSKDQGMDYSRPDALAFYSGKLYSIDGSGTISTHDPNSPGQTETTLGQTITGYTDDIGGFQIDSNGVYYLASSSNGSAISKSQGESTMTTSPRGLAYDTVNTYFYLLVNGSGGNDRIIVTDTSGTQVGSSIDTGETSVEGITYEDGNIWAIFGGDQNDAKIKAYDIANSSWGSDVTLTVSQNARDYRGLTYNGEFLFLIQGADGNLQLNETNGDQESSGRMSWGAQYVGSGAESAAYHSSKGHYYLGKGDDIVVVTAINGNDTEEALAYNDLDSADSLGGGGLKTKGLVVVGDVIYIADDRNDAILKASIPTGETTTPQALTNDGTYLWLVTDGTAGADTLLKLNATTGAKEAAFTMESDDVQGLTYMDNELWAMVNGGNNQGCKIQKIDVSDGSNDGSPTTIGDNNWCDGFGGMSTDGDDLFVMGATNQQYKSYDTNGNEQSNKNINDMSNGGRAVAINSSGQSWVGRGNTIDAFTAGSWDMEQVAGMQQENLTVTGGEDLDVKGMTWMGSTLYIADDETDYIYKTAAPAGSNDLLGMATDGTDLYLLVNNTPNDSIMKVDVSGTKDTSFGTSGVLDTNKSGANAVAVFDSQLWVAELEQGNMGSSWKFQGYNLSNGSAGTDFEYNQVPQGQSEIKGLASDGASLFVGHNNMADPYCGQCGGLILFDDNGNDTSNNINLNDEFGSGVSSLGALAVRSQSPEIISALNDEITTYGSDGSYSETFQTAINNITGLAAIGHVVYVGDTDNNKVLKAAVPLTQSTIDTQGKAMAVDGDNIFIVVEASPRDYVIKVDTSGNFVTAFNSGGSAELPVDNVEGIEVLGDYLYAVAMDSGGGFGQPSGKLYRLNKSTAALEATFTMPQPCGQGPCYNGVGGLGLNEAGDGLLVGVTKDCYMCGGTELFGWDPDNSNNWDTVYQQQAGSPSAIAAANDFIYIAEEVKLHQFEEGNNDLTHNKTDSLSINANIKGLAYVGTTMYLSVYDNNNSKGTVRGLTLNENIPELTVIGSYTSTLAASGVGFSTTDTSASFSIAKATSSTVAVTSPTSGFSVFTKAMPITGTVNDPAVETVSVGVDLPFTELFKDSADDGATSTGKMTATGMWNAACESDNGDVKAESGTCSWYYGQTDDMNYDNNAQNSGTLQLKEAISIVSADVSFTFDTWWDTEPGLDYDRKIVEVSENGSSWTTIAAILGPFDIDQGSGNPWYTPSALSGVQQWLLVPQANMGGMQFSNNFDPYAMCPPNCGNQGGGGGGGGADPVWESVEVDLSAYVGKTIFIRFSFDTMDAWVNDMQGWFVDNIEIGGAGFDGTTAVVTPSTAAEKLATPGVYGTWSTTFNLAEGINKIKVNSVNPYDSSLTSAVEVSGFLDTTPPTITIDESGVTSPTNQPTVTVTGTIDDINFQEMKIKQTTVSGEKTIVTVKTLPENKTFSKVASLSEGVNTFTATTKDGAGLEASATLTVILDTTGPVLTVNTPSYPLGAQSGRQGDVVIFSVDASSTGSAVDRLEVTYPGNGGTQRFKPANDIPEAIRDLWAVDGDFILATKIPDNASPGNYGLTVKAYDKAGNSSTKTIEAQVVSSLEAFNINLMPDWNLVSLPLMPDNGAISSMTNGVSGIDSVWYYDATSTAADPADRWLVYTASSQDVDTLSTFATGRGYWFKMDPTAFTLSAALAPGLPQTPKAIKMTYTGQFVAPGTLPPSYAVTTGWNAMGFHSENDLPVTTALQSLESPQRIWGSLLQYNNRIVFEIPDDPTEEPTFEILLGAFERLLSTSDLTPGYGYWIYMVEDGVITP